MRVFGNHQVSVVPTAGHGRSSCVVVDRRSMEGADVDADVCVDVLVQAELLAHPREHGRSSLTGGFGRRMAARASQCCLAEEGTAGVIGMAHALVREEAAVDSDPASEHRAPAHDVDGPCRAVAVDDRDEAAMKSARSFEADREGRRKTAAEAEAAVVPAGEDVDVEDVVDEVAAEVETRFGCEEVVRRRVVQCEGVCCQVVQDPCQLVVYMSR